MEFQLLKWMRLNRFRVSNDQIALASSLSWKCCLQTGKYTLFNLPICVIAAIKLDMTLKPTHWALLVALCFSSNVGFCWPLRNEYLWRNCWQLQCLLGTRSLSPKPIFHVSPSSTKRPTYLLLWGIIMRRSCDCKMHPFTSKLEKASAFYFSNFCSSERCGSCNSW